MLGNSKIKITQTETHKTEMELTMAITVQPELQRQQIQKKKLAEPNFTQIVIAIQHTKSTLT